MLLASTAKEAEQALLQLGHLILGEELDFRNTGDEYIYAKVDRLADHDRHTIIELTISLHMLDWIYNGGSNQTSRNVLKTIEKMHERTADPENN